MPKTDWKLDDECLLDREPAYPEVLDCIIVGAGPAGMTAGVYAARRKLTTLMICGNIGGQMNACSDIQNWTGVAQSTGPMLRDQFFAHVKRIDDDNAHYDLWVREGEKVLKITKDNNLFTVVTDKDQPFVAKTIVCTTGKIPRTLGVPGEVEAMKGKGLSFAPTSDAPLYKDQKMVVIGGGNSAMDVTLQLEKYTEDITIMTNLDHLIGDTCMMEKIKKNKGIKIEYNVGIQAVLLHESGYVRGVKMEQNGTVQEFECEGIFEEIGYTPATDFAADLVDRNDLQEIVTDRLMRSSEPGFFAAGDCNDGYHKQVIVAAGEGAVAALQAHEYLLKS